MWKVYNWACNRRFDKPDAGLIFLSGERSQTERKEFRSTKRVTDGVSKYTFALNPRQRIGSIL